MNCRMIICVALFAGLHAAAFAATKKVANVAELEDAVWNATAGDVIQLTNTALRVYDLSTTTHKGTPGHLYTDKKITLLGATDKPEDIVIRGASNRILYLAGQGNTIRNLTFENGDVTDYEKQTTVQPYDYPRGGAIIFSRSSAGTVSNCVFRNNRAKLAGGAAATYTSQNTTSASFIDCVFTNNEVTADNAQGGAISMALDVTHCFFGDHHLTGSESTGGAVFNARSIVDCTFTNNSAVKGGGAVYFQANTATANPVVSGCTFVGNHANDNGSAIKAPATWGEALLVSNCTFRGNAPLEGGTLNGTVANLANVVGCTFRSNVASFGGAAYSSVLKGCVIECNTATDAGGAAYGSTLVSCTNRANVNASANVKASELGSNCSATDCLFENIGNSAKFAFDGGTYDRCRFVSVTNGYLFSGAFALTNCLIADSSNCYLFFKTAAAARMFNVTIANNVFAGFKTSHTCPGKIVIENTFFCGNSLNGKSYDIDQYAKDAVDAFNHCIFSAADAAYAPGEDNLNYYGTSFRPGFVGPEASPTDPYALKRTSPAVKKEGLVGDWMATATDIRGAGFPRLGVDGNVNIGCYQCWLDPTGLLMLLR